MDPILGPSQNQRIIIQGQSRNYVRKRWPMTHPNQNKTRKRKNPNITPVITAHQTQIIAQAHLLIPISICHTEASDTAQAHQIQVHRLTTILIKITQDMDHIQVI